MRALSALRAVPRLTALSLSAAVLCAGCYKHHARDEAELNDAGLDAASPDAAPPPPCASRCPAPRLVGEAMSMPLGRFRMGVFDVATVQDTQAVLVAEPHEPPIGYGEYVLYLHSAGEELLRPSTDSVGLTARTVMDGTLVARPDSFVAVLLIWRDVEGEGGPWAGLHLAEWSTEGELLRSAELAEVAALSDMACRGAAGLPCHTRAAFRRGEADTVLVTLVAPPELYRARIDLESGSVSELPARPVPEGRRIGEPISVVTDDSGHLFAALGGPSPSGSSLARESTLLTFDGMGGSLARGDVPGLSYDPPAVLATVEGRPTLWRFVTNASRPLESAVQGWRLTADGMAEEPAWTIFASMGFRPSFIEVLESTARGEVVAWVGPDPRNLEHSMLSLLRVRPELEDCERLTPATAAQFPWALNAIASRPLAAIHDDEGVLAAVLGNRTAGDLPLVLLRIPTCE